MNTNTPNNSNRIQADSDALSENTTHLPAGRANGETIPLSAASTGPESTVLTPETGALGTVAGRSTPSYGAGASTPSPSLTASSNAKSWSYADLAGSSFSGDRTLIEALNDLIHTCRDGEKGFMQCEKEATDPSLKLTLRDLASRCATATVPLQEIVSVLGGTPANDGTISGAMHRGWTGLKTSVTSDKDHAILEECERGEDYAKRAYRKALDVDMPANVRQLIESQYQGVVECHDRVKALRDSHASMSV